MITPYAAAKAGTGAGVTARITRFRLDGGRCGMVQGRHAAWNWAYRVHVPGQRRTPPRKVIAMRRILLRA